MSDPTNDLPSEKQLIPNLAQILTPHTAVPPSPEAEEIGTAMRETFTQSVEAFQQQNVPASDQAVARMRFLYERAKEVIEGPVIFLHAAMTSMVSMYAMIARSQKFLMEGRFRRAREEVTKGRAACAEGIGLLEKLFEQSEEARKDAALRVSQVMFLAFGKMLSGTEIQISAEEIGYRGRIREYLEMLKGTVAEFRAGAELAGASDNPTVMAFRGMLTELADRLETRTEFFELGNSAGENYLNPTGRKIFVIHGHDEAKWRELADLLKDELKCEVIELSAQVNESRTIISKFEEYANQCCYAFALLTPDDFVKQGLDEKESGYLQARPNVLFELGWFYGRFGPKRLSIIRKAGTQMPTDLAGIGYIEFTKDVREAFMQIRDELKQAGAVARQ